MTAGAGSRRLLQSLSDTQLLMLSFVALIGVGTADLLVLPGLHAGRPRAAGRPDSELEKVLKPIQEMAIPPGGSGARCGSGVCLRTTRSRWWPSTTPPRTPS